MKESTSREKILKNVRNALITKTDVPFPYVECDSSVYNEKDEEPAIVFAEAFKNVAGKFVFCENNKELFTKLKELIKQNNWVNVYCSDENLKKLFDKEKISVTNNKEDFLTIDAGITSCEYLVARLGSIVVSSRQLAGRSTAVYPPVHIVIAKLSQILPDLKDVISEMKKKYNDNMPSLISIITGPSRTADIEKTLVMGAHGPKELYCFLIDN